MENFSNDCHGKSIVILDIPDDYQFMEEELIEEIQTKVSEYLNY